MDSRKIQLDSSLETAIATEALDGRNTLFHDMRRGFHAKAVIAELEHSKVSRREGTVWGGDGEFREVARGSEAAFQYLYQTYGPEEMDGDDLLAFQMRRNPEMRTKYFRKNPAVFFPAAVTAGIIQAGKYSPARA